MHSYFKEILQRDELLSKSLERVYQHAPQAHLVNETASLHEIQRMQTWDILTESLSFAPVAYSQITAKRGVLDVDNLLFLEEVMKNKSGKIIVEKLIDDTGIEQVEKYLKRPCYGRVASFHINGKEAAKLVEFVSKEPNQKAGLTLFDYLSPNKPNVRIDDILLHLHEYLETNKKRVLDAMLPNISVEDLALIDAEVSRVEHIAFMLSPAVREESLDLLLNLSGFPEEHMSFPSKILAKELGALIGKDEVETKIIKAWGTSSSQQKIGVEIFIPKEHPNTINHWICQGIGSHLALRVKSEKSIELLKEILTRYGAIIPKFMNGSAMKNSVEQSTSIYFDIQVQTHNFRLEFYYKP